VRKFLIGLVAGFLLAGLTVVILVFAAAKLGDRPPAVPEKGTLVVKLEGALPEQAPVSIPLPWFESHSPMTMHEVWDIFRKAEKDSRVQAIVVEPSELAVGWARLTEIRDAMVRFKRSGKPLIAYLRGPGAREYFLATAADEIYFSREDVLDLKGLRAEITYYRRTLDKLGIQLELEHAGKYKDAGDAFTRTSMSPETREVLNSMLDIVFNQLVDTIAAARKQPSAKVRELIDQGPFLAPKAVEAKLLDGLLYPEQVFDQLKTRLKAKEIKRISARDYARVSGASLGLDGGKSIALVVGEGAISRGGEIDPLGEEEGIRSRPFIQLLRKVADDTSIRAAILRINSPGGDAIASDEILDAVRYLSKKKPLVISMSDLAASGGYYIAMTGDPVVAYPSTITGSIGVIYGKPNMRGLYDKLGFDTDVLTRGQYAEIDGLYKPLSPAERKKLREGVDFVYQSFLARVSEGRRRPVAEIEPVAQGRAWMGVQAKQQGLVDELGGFDRAIELVRQRAGIGANEKIRLVMFPRRRSLLEQILKSSEEPVAEVIARKRVNQWMRRMGLGSSFQVLLSGGYLRMAPYQVDFR
jgi:protease-4